MAEMNWGPVLMQLSKRVKQKRKQKAMADTIESARKKGYDVSMEYNPQTGWGVKLNYKSKKDYKDLIIEKWRAGGQLTPQEQKFIGAYVKPESEELSTKGDINELQDLLVNRKKPATSPANTDPGILERGTDYITQLLQGLFNKQTPSREIQTQGRQGRYKVTPIQ
jgi:hypothetical protein